MLAYYELTNKQLEIIIENDRDLQKLFKKYDYKCNFKDFDWWNINKEIFIQYFYSKENLCISNRNIDLCKQDTPGTTFNICIENNNLFLKSMECKCSFWKKIQRNYLYYDFPTENLQLNFANSNYRKIKSRKELIENFVSFIQKTENNKKLLNLNGIYLYGPPGVGKTFSFLLLANKLAQNNHKVVFISVPKLIMLLKKTYNNKEYNDTHINHICLKADFLFLDDIGGELVTEWVRDEILFNILDYRTSHKKITFFTSNYSFNDLEKIYSKSRYKNNYKNNIDNIKSLRLIRRIKDFSEYIYLK